MEPTQREITMLLHLGYEVKKEIVNMAYHASHRESEYVDVEVWAVYKEGEPFCKPGGYNFEKDAWFERAFEAAWNDALYDLILSHKANRPYRNLKNADGYPRHEDDPL